ncbi:unnamed protein product [Paramecium sonneborni]|uniref:Uncharacterized protein n=1 Tax=Paramecium sonneborni TaxID=65129 RepID=A0A8S1PVI0_9CILI|nr:unnamed protein product [Paramecium sonneborni]
MPRLKERKKEKCLIYLYYQQIYQYLQLFIYSIVDNYELHMLLMIYKDLANRSQNHQICRESFNTYFKIIVCRIVMINLGNMG